jgi:hypothetical protein
MAITVDWVNKVIESTESITDLPAFHTLLRGLEDDPEGAIYPVTHTWKALDLGGGALFVQLDLINGYRLKFPSTGNYVINGNLNGDIVPVAGVYVERKTSSAYTTTAIGGSGPSAGDIADSVWSKALEGLSAEQMMRVMLAALAGKREGIGTVTEKYYGRDGVTPRITLTPDSNGNGTPVVNGS